MVLSAKRDPSTITSHHQPVLLTVLICTVFLLMTHPALSMQRLMRFDEIVRQADAIFIGKVTGQQARADADSKMIFTDVDFQLIESVAVSESRQKKIINPVRLDFAGGQLEDRWVKVSDVPVFENNKVYILFVRLGKGVGASPLIGAYQGLFQVSDDPTDGSAIVRDHAGKTVTGIADGRLLLASPPFGRPDQTSKTTRYQVPPKRVAESGSNAKARSAGVVAGEQVMKAMSLQTFIDEIKRLRNDTK